VQSSAAPADHGPCLQLQLCLQSQLGYKQCTLQQIAVLPDLIGKQALKYNVINYSLQAHLNRPSVLAVLAASKPAASDNQAGGHCVVLPRC
jgi:hypothetical protein